MNAFVSEDCSVFLSTIDSSTRARLGGHSDYLRMGVQVIGAPVNMYQKYQSCPPRVVSSLELLFGRGGTRVAQPLGHRWLYSVTESRRTTFSETASVRTTWDSSPAGSCPDVVDERLFFLGSNFSSERMTSDSSPADSCSDMVYEGRVLFCSMVSSVWTTSC